MPPRTKKSGMSRVWGGFKKLWTKRFWGEGPSDDEVGESQFSKSSELATTKR